MGDSGSKAAEIEWYPIPMLVATRRPDTASELRYDKKEERGGSGEWEEERKGGRRRGHLLHTQYYQIFHDRKGDLHQLVY